MTPKNKIRILLLHPAMAMMFGTCLMAQEQNFSSTNKQKKDAELIARELQNCPLWLMIKPKDVAQRKKVTDIYLKLAGYNTSTLRAGIAKYLGEVDYLYEGNAKVTALLPVVFKVPRRFVLRNGIPWTLAPRGSDGSVDLLWPYSMDKAGHYILTGGEGWYDYSGVPTDELADFDFYVSKFQRRSMSKGSKG